MRFSPSLVGLACLLYAHAGAGSTLTFSTKGMVRIPAGTYLPFFAPNAAKKPEPTKRKPVSVQSFWVDTHPVTNQQFLEFVRANPEWRKSKIKPIFSDGHYLERWASDFRLHDKREAWSPVTFVSWYAAEAYCESKGKELPTQDQWEYAAADQGKGTKEAKEKLLAWYSHPNPKTMPKVGSAGRNSYGVYDLYGLIWEWTLDFNSGIQTQEARDGGAKDGNLFCGSGSQGALDATDYASFMRYSFRNSLKANYTIANLGFRCAKGEDEND